MNEGSGRIAATRLSVLFVLIRRVLLAVGF